MGNPLPVMLISQVDLRFPAKRISPTRRIFLQGVIQKSVSVCQSATFCVARIFTVLCRYRVLLSSLRFELHDHRQRVFRADTFWQIQALTNRGEQNQCDVATMRPLYLQPPRCS